MAFTQVTVTGTVQLANQIPAAGATVTFLLSTPITDGVQTVAPSPVVATCSTAGTFSLTLNANNDATTSPAGSYYTVTVTYGPVILDTLYVTVPAADAPTFSLFSLPQVTPTSPPQVLTGIAVLGTDGTQGGPGGSPVNPNVVQTATATASYQRLTVAAPAAGAEWSYTVPAGTWVRWLEAFGTLTTSATVANRYPGWRLFDNAGAQIGGAALAIAATASTTGIRLCQSRGNSFQGIGNPDGVRDVKLDHPGQILAPGYQVQSYTQGLQATDQYSSVQVLLETWTIEPTYDGLGPSLS